VLFIQEKMVCVTKSREFFAKLLPNWLFYGVDFLGHFGGFLMAWNPRKDEFTSFLTRAKILLEGFVKDLDKRMKLRNFYGLYSGRAVY